MKRSFKVFIVLIFSMLLSAVPLFASAAAERPTMHKIASYESGEYNVDGGVMEIIAYNKTNGFAYSVNGQSGVLTSIDLSVLEGNGTGINLSGNDIDVKSLVEDADPSFTYGDMTSVTVSQDGTLLALAIQAEAYNAPGRIAVFRCGLDGDLSLVSLMECGVQPDMIVFADADTVLTANEGEPREGYGEGLDDPAGSVTIARIDTKETVNVGFEAFDTEEKRNELISRNVIIMKDRLPSADFEPEYIAVSGDRAYVTLQEANAIAVLDIQNQEFEDIFSAGFEDYSVIPVDIDKKDDAYSPALYDSLRGIRMPDGIAVFEIDGTDYLITANEGDAREWGDEEAGTFYISEDERDFADGDSSPTGRVTAENSQLGGKVVFFASGDFDGLDEDTDYIFGGRSFTVYAVTASGIMEVATSGCDLEALTAQLYPEFYNASNDNAVLDDRSGKKGPEAESVATGVIDGRTYAFTALERTGGVMMYDVSVPESPVFADYINTRDFRSIVDGSQEYDDGDLDKWVTGGDVAPEGLAFISAQDSPTSRAILLVANEVSGTVSVYEIH